MNFFPKVASTAAVPSAVAIMNEARRLAGRPDSALADQPALAAPAWARLSFGPFACAPRMPPMPQPTLPLTPGPAALWNAVVRADGSFAVELCNVLARELDKAMNSGEFARLTDQYTAAPYLYNRRVARESVALFIASRSAARMERDEAVRALTAPPFIALPSSAALPADLHACGLDAGSDPQFAKAFVQTVRENLEPESFSRRVEVHVPEMVSRNREVARIQAATNVLNQILGQWPSMR